MTVVLRIRRELWNWSLRHSRLVVILVKRTYKSECLLKPTKRLIKFASQMHVMLPGRSRTPTRLKVVVERLFACWPKLKNLTMVQTTSITHWFMEQWAIWIKRSTNWKRFGLDVSWPRQSSMTRNLIHYVRIPDSKTSSNGATSKNKTQQVVGASLRGRPLLHKEFSLQRGRLHCGPP